MPTTLTEVIIHLTTGRKLWLNTGPNGGVFLSINDAAGKEHSTTLSKDDMKALRQALYGWGS